MSYKINNGEYETDESGMPIKVCYKDELLQNAALAIGCKRGRFYPDKDFGSRLSMLCREPIEEYAESYIRQALSALDGAFLKKVTRGDGVLTAEFEINGEEKEVVFQLEEGI